MISLTTGGIYSNAGAVPGRNGGMVSDDEESNGTFATEFQSETGTSPRPREPGSREGSPSYNFKMVPVSSPEQQPVLLWLQTVHSLSPRAFFSYSYFRFF